MKHSDKYNIDFIKVTAIIVLFFCSMFLPGINSYIGRFENTLIDLRQSLWVKANHYDHSIVIIDIDPSSINKLSLWPWPRTFWAQAIDHLIDYNPAVIGVDVLFDNESPNPVEDDAFSKVLAKADNIVLASRKFSRKQANYEIETWTTPIKKFADYAQFGFVNFPVDTDGVTRKAFKRLSSQGVGHHRSFVDLVTAYVDSEKVVVDSRAMFGVNTSEPTFFVNFMLNRSFKRIPFYLVYENRIPPTVDLENSIVLIGASDPALNDLFFSPLGQIPGVDIHAHTIATLLEQQFIYPVNPYVNLAFIFILVLLNSFITLYRGGLNSFFTVTLNAVGYSLVSMWLMYAHSMLVQWAPFLVLLTLSYASTLIFKVISEEQQRKLVRSVFNQYVAPEVVKKLIESPEALELGGQRKEVSIFFSDIRSFTTLSEMYDPELIISQLNEYLDVMTHSIFQCNGTLDKYVGDEIMAIWGAPIDDPYHALKAVHCGWKQLELLKQLHETWQIKNKPLFDIGIGINTGEVIVGNIGSTIMKDYTVIGDHVNYAARLEGVTRQFSTDDHVCRFIISHTTYAAVKDYCQVKTLGDIPVKGKKKTFPIYEVIGFDEHNLPYSFS